MKNLHSNCFVTSFENDVNVASKCNNSCHLEVHWRKYQDPEPNPESDPYQNVTDLQHIDQLLHWLKLKGEALIFEVLIFVFKISEGISKGWDLYKKNLQIYLIIRVLTTPADFR